MDAPSDYKTAGIFMVIAGATTTLAGVLNVVFSACLFFWAFLAVGAGIAEIVTAIGILQGQRRPSAMVVSIVGILGALTVCNGLGLLMEILAIVWLQKPEVKQWLANA